MSIAAIAWALRQDVRQLIGKFNLNTDDDSQIHERAASPAKFVLVALANYANDEGFCFPRQKVISHDVEQSVSSVARRLKDLERLQLIHRTGQTRATGGRTVDLYRLAMHSSPSSCEGRPVNLTGGTRHSWRGKDEPSKEPIIKLPLESGKGSKAGKGTRGKRHSLIGGDRGEFETQIVKRLGIGARGWDVLAALPDWQLDQLCARQRTGSLGSDELSRLAQKFEAVT